MAQVKVTVLSFTISPEELIETAGRTCYRSKGVGSDTFIRNRIKEGHESIIEHASITFKIDGISRACSHQLVRHRIASYSQESQRYVDMSEPEFVVPPSILESDDDFALSLWQATLDYMTDVYQRLREKGIRKEDARYLLPNATKTTIIVTMNFRALRNFFEVRCDKAAQWEIRELAMQMLDISYTLAPAVFGDLHDKFIAGNTTQDGV